MAGRVGPNDDAAAPGMRLQARSDIDRVPKGVVPLLVRPRVAEQNDGPRVDADPDRYFDPVRLGNVPGVSSQHRLHPDGRPHRPLRVVVMRPRRAEQRVQPITRELRDDPAEPSHLRRQQTRDLVEKELRPLRPERLADRRRANNVYEKHRNDPPLASKRRHPPIISARDGNTKPTSRQPHQEAAAKASTASTSNTNTVTATPRLEAASARRAGGRTALGVEPDQLTVELRVGRDRRPQTRQQRGHVPPAPRARPVAGVYADEAPEPSSFGSKVQPRPVGMLPGARAQ